MRFDAQAVRGELGPDVVRASRRVTSELELEERPADVEHDRAVAVEEGLAWFRRDAQPALLPGRLRAVPAEDVGDALVVGGVPGRALEVGRPGPDGRVMERVPALMEQLDELAEASGRIRGEDPGGPRSRVAGRP